MASKKRDSFQALSSASAVAPHAPVAAQEVLVPFVLSAPQAKNVSVAGTFNHWDVMALNMKKGKQGRWSAKIPLKPGCYEYLFMVDGQWLKDPGGEETIPNVFGSVNSVLRVG